MNCREIEIILPAFLENDCSAEERAIVESHLGDCPACTALAGEFRLLELALAARVDEIPPASPTVDAVMTRIRPRRRRVAIGRYLNVPSLAVLLFFLAAGVLYRFRESCGALLARDTNLGAILTRAAGQMADSLVQVSGGDIWVLCSIYGAVTLLILLAMGLSVQHVLRGGRV